MYFKLEIKMNDRIKDVRKHFKLSQTDFGFQIGVSRDTVANIEGGRIDVKDVIVKSICREFGVSETWLRTGDGEMFAELSQAEQLAAFFKDVDVDDGFKSKLVQALAGLNQDEWKAFEKVVLAMKERLDAETAAAADPEDDGLSDQSVADLEDQYKKEVLNTAASTESSALNITGGTA